jgi:hypothetical protein
VLCYRGQGVNFEQYPTLTNALMLTARGMLQPTVPTVRPRTALRLE